ncbi:MAG: hypothetical protein CMG66_02575 [Candidatus Marinimicrobia bacterium]|nr:hypothetical protein [Candidatus Neomarinimicrobiota bacterium]
MEKTLILYPAFAMMFLTWFLYFKNHSDNRKAAKNKSIKFSYFKAYQGEVPDYVTVSRQTLKNQFELPIFFYFLISVILAFDKVSQLDLILAWIFVVSRYLHCYIRLSSNYVPYRAKVFKLGMLVLIVWWSIFIYNII